MSIGVYPQQRNRNLGDGNGVDDALVKVVVEDALKTRSALPWADFFGYILPMIGEPAPENDEQSVRAGLSTPSLLNVFLNVVNVEFFAGYDSVPDTTEGWVTLGNVSNFLPAYALAPYESGRLIPATRGKPALDGHFGLLAEQWRIIRYSRQITLDEVDLLSSGSVDLTLLSIREIGRMSARLIPDSVYSLILRNPAMTADNKNFFSIDHGNYATTGSRLGDSSGQYFAPLATAMEAVASQTAPDLEHGIPITLGLRPMYLVAAPSQLYGARALARLLWLADESNLIVRCEPRLSVGVVDPATGAEVTGYANGWLLASPAKIAPSIIVGGLGETPTKPKPVIRQLELGAGVGQPGEFGVAFDVKMDCGVVGVDWRSLYLATGQ
jgi:hypothetical protein